MRAILPFVFLLYNLLTASLASSTERIVFSGGPRGDLGGIYSINPDGSDLAPVILNERTEGITVGSVIFNSGIKGHGTPAWSPDGSRIAFASNRDTPSFPDLAIFIANADGSNIVSITAGSGGAEPAWSPDGTQLIFADHSRPGPSSNLNATSLFTVLANGNRRALLTEVNEFADAMPAWSPDGAKIAFSSDRDGPTSIYTVDADGSNITRITQFDGRDLHPAWSPDGAKIAFARYASELALGIYIVNADGSGLIPVIEDSLHVNTQPVWSPDGSKIAFASDRDGSMAIFTAGVDGSNVNRVTGADVLGADPDWVLVTADAPPANPYAPVQAADPAPNDTDLAPPAPPSGPIALARGALQFGELFVGTADTIVVTVRNDSEEGVSSFPATAIGQGARNFRTDPARIEIPAGGETAFDVIFEPFAAGASSVVLNIDFGVGFVEMALTGTAMATAPPIADFSVDYLDEPFTLHFRDRSRGAAIGNYNWDFGDGTTSIEANPTHAYDRDGLYEVELTVSNASGIHATSRTVHAAMPADGAVGMSTASFNASPMRGRAPLTVDFSTDAAAAALYHWDFGDGTTGVGPTPTHRYTAPGDYLVLLDVRDGETRRQHVERISVFPALPVDFATTSRFGFVPHRVDFTSALTDPSLNYIWRFGDGFSSIAPNPSHTYRTPGIYDVELIVSDRHGAQAVLKEKAVGVLEPGSVVVFGEVDTLDFGPVIVGQTRTVPLKLVNISAQAVHSFPIAFLGSNRSNFGVAPERLTLGATSADPIEFTFAPNATGDFSAVANMDFNFAFVEVALKGRGVPPPPLLALETLALDLPPQGQGTTSSRSFWLNNRGPGDLAVSAIGIDGANFTAAPAVFSIAPGDTQRVVVTYLHAAPGVHTGILTLHSNARDSPALDIALTAETTAPPRIRLGTDKVEFQTGSVGAVAARTFQVSNAGGTDLIVAMASVDSADYAVAPRSFTIAPGQAQELAVTYDRARPGEAPAVLALHSDDPETPVAYVRLQGTTRFPPRIVLSPSDTLDFGTIEFGDRPTRTLMITNAGGDTLRDTLSLGHERFALATATPLTIAPGASATAGVRFLPRTATRYQARLEHRTNDPTAPLASLVIRGRAVRDLQKGSLSGRAHYPDDSAVLGTIALVGADNEIVDELGLSDRGSFHFFNVPAGHYVLLVREVDDLIGTSFRHGADAPGDSIRVIGGEQITGLRIVVDTTATEVPLAADLQFDLDVAPGPQGLTATEVPAGTPFALSLYADPIGQLTGYSTHIAFDTTQVSLVQVDEKAPQEANILQRSTGTALFLVLPFAAGGVRHGGSILGADEGTAVSAGGLLNTWYFRTRDDFDAPTEIRLTEAVARTLFDRRVARPDLVARIQPPGTGFSPIRLDLDPAPGNQALYRRLDLPPNAAVDLEFFLEGASSVSGYGLLLEYEPAALEIDLDAFAVDAVADQKTIPLARRTDAHILELGAALLGGVFDQGRLGALRLDLQPDFIGTTEITLREVVLNAAGRPPQTVSTKDVLTLTVVSPTAKIDFNGDDRLTFADFFLFAEALGQGDADPRYDLDGDGQVNLADFFRFADLFALDDATRGKLLALARAHIGLPARSHLGQNYPNPFNSQTLIRLLVAAADPIEVAVYNLSGQKVKTLASGDLRPGVHTLIWDGRDERGRALASGVYFYRLQMANGLAQTRKILLLR